MSLTIIDDSHIPADVPFASVGIGSGFVFGGELFQKIDNAQAFNESAPAVVGFTTQTVSPRDLTVKQTLPA